ncbi:MAG TPA: pyridoxal-phosphate dependent enzyme [Candidatus Limnocylindria bacterium]|nr:pyridoxal-phosphate dependent enzyme [Candidatus Limnocylindria bacterium]
MVRVTAETIRSAHQRIPSAFRDSPQFISEPLSEQIGLAVVVKLETPNPIGSFKGRGTWLALSDLVEAGRVGEERGVVVASAGNFGQGVAYAARAMKVPVTVMAATTANPAKVAGMRRLGADVRLVGEDFDAARLAAADLALRTGWHLLVDGEDPWIAIGAGTIALEVTDASAAGELPSLERFYVPVGNGALIAGIGTWIRSTTPSTRVIGVQAAGAPAMTLSWRERRPIETPTADTVADGIAARVPVPEALALMLEVVDEMLLVDEDQIVAATNQLSGALPSTIEPAAGAAWAAVRAAEAQRGAIGLVVTGGNVSP